MIVGRLTATPSRQLGGGDIVQANQNILVNLVDYNSPVNTV